MQKRKLEIHRKRRGRNSVEQVALKDTNHLVARIVAPAWRDKYEVRVTDLDSGEVVGEVTKVDGGWTWWHEARGVGQHEGGTP